MRLVALPATVLTALGTFRGMSRYLTQFFFSPDNPRRITRAAALHRDIESRPPPLTAARVWRLVGPTASAGARAAFTRVYGRHLVVWLHAAVAALVVAAVLQPVYEAPFAVRLSLGARALAEKAWLQEQRDGQQAFSRSQEMLRGGPEAQLAASSREALAQEAARQQVALPGMLSGAEDRR